MRKQPIASDPDRKHTFMMTERKAELVHKVVGSHMQALKNWACGAVESGDIEYAQKLVAELREYESLYAAFNMTAKREIAGYTEKAIVIAHDVREGRWP